MLRFLKIFAGKMDILSVNTTSLCKQKCYLIGCQEKRPFFRRKSLTLVILTLTPGIDFTKLHYGRKLFRQIFILKFWTKSIQM
jgi:hypothetical protein